MHIRDTEKKKFFKDEKRKPFVLNAMFTSYDDVRETGQRIRDLAQTFTHTHLLLFNEQCRKEVQHCYLHFTDEKAKAQRRQEAL